MEKTPTQTDSDSSTGTKSKPQNRARSLSRPQKIIRVVLCVAALTLVIFIVIKITSSSTPEDKLRQIARDYYTDNIQPATKRSTSYTLVLKNLQQIGYDISSFEKAGCSLDSYAVIYLHNSSGESNEITYDIETKLIDCE